MGANAGSVGAVASARGADSAPQGGAETRGMDHGANRGNASRLSPLGLVSAAGEDKSRILEDRKAYLRKISKYVPSVEIRRSDPCCLSSRYSETEIRKMIAEGRVIEMKGHRRLVIRP